MVTNLKKLIPHIVAIAVFIALSSFYFSPLFDGFALRQSDVKQYQGMSKEINDYRILNDDEALWTNAMFSGMPAYQISVLHSKNLLRYVDKGLKLSFMLPRPVGMLFMAMLGFYIFALCMRIDPYIGMIGAVAFGFSTINILYLGAGHVTKVNAIAYMAPSLGGMLLAFRGRWLLGSALFALFFGLNLTANHLQMTYYLVWLLGIVGVAELVRLIMEKQYTYLVKSVSALILGLFFAILPSSSNLFTTNEYSRYTTRGATDLTIEPEGKPKDESTIKGLNKDYILEYNFAYGEILSILAPNAKGAKNDYLGNDESAMANADPAYSQQLAQMDRYWGGQRMSGGAFYFGVVMFAIFVFGLIFLKDNLRWPFLLLGILAALLASKDPGGINGWFIDNFPVYNKFRDSKMILVLLQVMIPALAVLTLDRFLKKENVWGDKKIWLYGAGGIVAFLVVLYLIPGISGNFIKSEEVQMFAKAAENPDQASFVNGLKEALIEARTSLYKSDMGRAVLLALAGLGIMLLSVYTALSARIIALIALALVVFDNISVAKRYLNNEEEGGTYASYEPIESAQIPTLPALADGTILNYERGSIPNFEQKVADLKSKMENDALYAGLGSQELEMMAAFGVLHLNTNYRVFSFQNPFNETTTSFFHKSIGGYHGAKLKRYQELIDFHISKEFTKVNEAISEEKNKLLRFYASQMPISQEDAQKVFDTIQISAIDLSTKAPVLNMLNTRYVLLDRNKQPLRNTAANGNAWLIENVKKVKGTNEEMLALYELNNKTDMVLNSGAFVEESSKLKESYNTDSTDNVRLTNYATKALTYQVSTKNERPLVFSEIYYPEGWNCYVDGKLTPYFRANYLLRAIVIPAGDHKVEWKFEPRNFERGQTFAMIGSVLIFIFLGAGIFVTVKEKEEEK
jgi:hypothetical protein